MTSSSQDQASALKEINGLLDELSAIARQNEEEAKAADENCGKALSSADVGVRVSKDLEQQIAEIESATSNITEALEQIEAIAKQTNLLSLNASVEAVRNGGDGGSAEGFKVVAQEIRALADRSAEAAGGIRGRVELVQEAVRRGVELVTETDGLLTEINAAVSDSTNAVRGLTESGRTQVRMSDQIASRISSVSNDSDGNFRMAIESAETAERLQSDAAQNIERMARFTRQDRATDLAA